MNAKATLLAIVLSMSGCLFGGSGTPSGRDAGDDVLPDSGISDSGNNGRIKDGGNTVPPNNISPDVGMECGDGLLQPQELCDPAHPTFMCPESCDDGLACTADTLTGSEATCDAACVSEPITVCVAGDGCCPSECTVDEDADCDTTVVCGDSVVNGAEKCDPGETSSNPCPMESADCAPAACQRAIIAGDASTCDAECAFIPVTSCMSDDGCCPTGCDEASDNDCAAVCGNDVIDPGELCDGNCPDLAACDDGNACTTNGLDVGAGACNVECTTSSITMCIDDDGCCPAQCANATDNDCSATCGDGTVQAGETCDNGAGSPDTCPTSCNDMDVCTTDTSTGSPANCNVVCANTPKTGCQADGCCVPGCNANNDPDCEPLCGNNAVEPPETCDGNCAANCDDGDSCTTDSSTGSAAACSLECSNVTVTMCTGGDGCCPAGCNSTNDGDCGVVCGNGIIEGNELCDGNCVASCDDGNACTVDVRSGSAGSCNVMCSYTTKTSCIDNDGCCPANCNSANDNDCSASCGNGVVEGAETCDGNCPNSCSGPCLQLTGAANQCNVECAPIAGCVPCDLNGTCSCNPGEVCQGGRCEPSSGGECDEACNPAPYCTVHGALGYVCDLNDGSCVECQLDQHCAPQDACLGNYCGDPGDCLLANNPDAYCLFYEGFNDCVDKTGTGVCRDSCTMNSECRPEQYCNQGSCDFALTCDVAGDPDGWCAASGGGDRCFNGACYYSCTTPCDCPWNDFPEACVGPTGSKICANQMPTRCENACAANGDDDYYCEYLYGPGAYCDPATSTQSDNCRIGSQSLDAGGP